MSVIKFVLGLIYIICALGYAGRMDYEEQVKREKNMNFTQLEQQR